MNGRGAEEDVHCAESVTGADLHDASYLLR